MRFLCLLLLSALAALASGELSGGRAPGFSLMGSDRKFHDAQDYRGKLLIIDIMQVSCEHCVKFSAVLEQVRAKYGDKVAILSIVNPPSDAKGVEDYIKQNQVKNQVLFDCGQVAASYLKPSKPQVQIPHVFLIDGDGI